MLKHVMFGLCLAALGGAARVRAAHAQTETTPPPEPAVAPPTASASVANPATSVIGWFQAVSGNDRTVQDRAFALREAEIAFQSAVDPFARADFFLSAGPEGLEVEEGYLTWLALPGGGQAKIGKFRADLGKFNRTHPPETPFADRPLAAEAFLGEEGLVTTGLSLSALVPNPMGLFWDATANVGTVPDSTESPVFSPVDRSDVMVLGRTSVFVPLGESGDVNFGISYANAAAAPDLRAAGNRSQLATADVTAHWKNPRRSIYRSLFAQVEGTVLRGSASGAEDRRGLFGYAIYQLARQWKLGARLDWTERPVGDDLRGALVLLSYQPSEFSTVSVEARRVHGDDEGDRDAAFFKWIFNIGPHGAHPY